MLDFTSSQAQTVAPVPNPGAISTQTQRVQQQIEQRFEPRIDGPAVTGPKPLDQLVAPPGGATFLLKEVIFDHSEFISEAELRAIAAKFIGRRVDISGLQTLVKQVNEIFAQRHVITALAYLPQQNLNTGKLHVAIVEGKLGDVTVKGNALLSKDRVTSTLTSSPGAVVDVARVERDVARFNATSNAQIQAALQPGANFGLTDISLSVLEPPVNALQIFVDNQGADSVGKLETGVNYQRYGIAGADDKLSVNLLGALGNQNGNIAYNVPFGLWGGRIGASAGIGQIRVVQGSYTSLNIRGTSQNEAINVSQPIYVDSTFALLLNGSLSWNGSTSLQSGVTVTDNETIKKTIGTTLRYADANFNLSVSPSVSFGRTVFSVTDTGEKFTELNGTLSSSIRMPLDFMATLSGSGQWANQVQLPGDQQFQIGGPTSVRGYSPDSVAGYAGYYTNLEIHHGLKGLIDGTDLFAFYDRGVTYSTFPKMVTLNSVGAGVSWQAPKYLVADLFVGVPVTKAVAQQPDYTVYFRLTAKFP